MTDRSAEQPGGLRRTLGVSDLVLLNIAAILGIRWLSTAAQMGPSSILLWFLAVLVFFIPSGLAVMELNSRESGEGGVYLWAKAAFGEQHGFIAGWTQAMEQIPDKKFCLPPAGQSLPGDLADLLVTYVDGHPDRIPSPAHEVVEETFIDAFPCPEETPETIEDPEP